jgi:SPP1 family predicted phage head-tail adaptor
MARTLFTQLRRLSIAHLRHKMTIEQPVDSDDGAGGVTRSFSTLDTVWAAIEQLGADRDIDENRAAALLTHRITLRWRADLDTSKRLKLGARIFTVHAVADADERRRRITLLAQEISP